MSCYKFSQKRWTTFTESYIIVFMVTTNTHVNYQISSKNIKKFNINFKPKFQLQAIKRMMQMHNARNIEKKNICTLMCTVSASMLLDNF